jgi:hypothetical protein
MKYLTIIVLGAGLAGCYRTASNDEFDGDGGDTETDDNKDSGTHKDADAGTDMDTDDYVYYARAMPGGLNRIFVWRTDISANRCTRLSLQTVVPGGETVPDDWGWDAINTGTRTDSTNCITTDQFPEAATSAEGTFAWPPMQIDHSFPCEMSINYTISFPDTGTIEIHAVDLAIDNCKNPYQSSP